MKKIIALILTITFVSIIMITFLYDGGFPGFISYCKTTKFGRCISILSENSVDQKKNYGKYNPYDYYERAQFFEKKESFLKAFLYYERVCEIAPDTDIAQKARLKMRKLDNKIDKSQIISKH